MTATPLEVNADLVPMGENTGVPAALDFPLAANAQAAKLEYITLDPSTGMGSLTDDGTPNQIMAGFVHPDELTTTDATAGNARARVSQRWAEHKAPSTIASDGFSAADVGVPFWLADGRTPGKLSHTGTLAAATLKNRTLGGLVFGLVKTGSTAIRHWAGPVAQAIARGVLMANGAVLGWYDHVVDGAASTTTAEKTIHRAPVHGTITSVRYTSMGTLAADNTDYVTINVYKADGAAGTHVLVASYDSRAANQGAIAAGVPKAFALSAVAGALNLLESDILTYEVLKAGSGKIVPVGVLEVIGKVI